MSTKDTWSLGGHEFTSRFILGSGKFSLDLVKACIEMPRRQCESPDYQEKWDVGIL